MKRILRRLIATILITVLGVEAAVALEPRAIATEQLVAQGVAPGDAAARVAAMTDEEAAAVASAMHSLPAGGHGNGVAGVLGVALAVVIVVYALPFILLGAGVYAVAKGGGRSVPAES